MSVCCARFVSIIYTIHLKGGDKLTLNLIGPQNNNATTSSPSNPSTPKHFSLLQPEPVTPKPSNATLNGVSVTHYSEQRGAMEKISIPSVNVFSAEIKTPKLDNSAHSNNLIQLDDSPVPTKNNNPFLNMSPQLTPTTTVSSHNPFKVTPTTLFSGGGSSTSPVVASPTVIATTTTTVQSQNPFRDPMEQDITNGNGRPLIDVTDAPTVQNNNGETKVQNSSRVSETIEKKVSSGGCG